MSDFDALPYTFRVMGEDVGPNGAMAKMPPYWLLMDHTVAVIWCLCSPDNRKILGMTQLYWAKLMLEQVKTKYGDYTPDVQMLIEVIEDRLIGLYATIASRQAREETAHNRTLNNLHSHFDLRTALKTFKPPGAEGYVNTSMAYKMDFNKTAVQFVPQPVIRPSAVYEEVARLSPKYKDQPFGGKHREEGASARRHLKYTGSVESVKSISSRGGSTTCKQPEYESADKMYRLRAQNLERLKEDMKSIEIVEECMRSQGCKFSPLIDHEFKERMDMLDADAE